MDDIKLIIGGKEYAIPLPINLDTGLRIADAIDAYTAASAKIGQPGDRGQGVWRALMNKRASAAAIVAGCLVTVDPKVTQDYIRKTVSVMGADGQLNPEGEALLEAIPKILLASGYFSDDDIKRADDAAKKAAEVGEAQPAEAGQP